jgi:long-chain acyl-CoA synthetase
MTFIDDIFARLQTAANVAILQEFQNEGRVSVTGQELLAMVAVARRFFTSRGLKKGDRCVLLAANSIRWIAADLAAMSDGLIIVPLYSRQAAAELATMMKDCSPALICCGDVALRNMVLQHWPDAPPQVLFDDIFAAGQSSEGMVSPKPTELGPSDPVTIIYTSGTSGEVKGAILTAGNITHILGCTSDQFDLLMKDHQGQDRAFHYAPFCFAASRITMLTALRRGTLFMLNSDLSKIAEQMRAAAPDYIINVPALLERMRRAVDEQLWKSGGFPLTVYAHGKVGWLRERAGEAKFTDRFWLALANMVVFPTIRKKMIGSNLKALICGSAPLNVETQLYFMMLGIPVLQVYGLTETTAICTMDDPRDVEPGFVGPAIPGIEMKLGENDEILVRGPNIFPGYWNRPAETAKVLHDGWFHTGDQGAVDVRGNWRIAGRIKNLIILNSGHNVAPEPLENELSQNLPEAQQVVLVGNGRSYLSVVVTGNVEDGRVQAAIDALNAHLPHYKQIRAFYVQPEPFTIESGLLTANGKLKREAISAHLKDAIEKMYAVKRAV